MLHKGGPRFRDARVIRAAFALFGVVAAVTLCPVRTQRAVIGLGGFDFCVVRLQNCSHVTNLIVFQLFWRLFFLTGLIQALDERNEL